MLLMGNEMSQNQLLHKIMEYDFAIYDLAEFLDTHPDDEQSIALYMDLKKQSKMYTKEYVRLYGPLNHKQVTDENCWTWVSTPWPWEGGC